MVQSDYQAVRMSTNYCSHYDDHHIRIEHCASGIYLYGCRHGEINEQRITRIEVNLEPDQTSPENRSCPVDERRTRPYRHLHVPAWSSWSMGRDAVMHDAWALRYTRLGIGAELYRRAANIVPNARWTAFTLFDGSKALRARLHGVDPWRWEYPDCVTCADATRPWGDTTRADITASHSAVGAVVR